MVKKKFEKSNFPAVAVLLFLVGIMVFRAQCNSPSNLVKRTLQNSYYAKVTDIYLEKTGNNTYRLINAPIDSVSGVQLENWRVEYFGTGFLAFAEPLDVPTYDEIKLNVNIRLTNEQYQQLQLLADEQKISPEQVARDILWQKLNCQ